MDDLSRREFLKLTGGAVAATQLGRIPLVGGAPDETLAGARGLTTIARTIVRGERVRSGTEGAYHRLRYGDGEPHVVREELTRKTLAPISRAMSFVHFTDIHLIDAQSPARVEFLDRYADSGCNQEFVTSAHRPQEA